MVTRKTKRKSVPHFEFEAFPTEISLSSDNFLAIQSEFHVVEKGIYFDKGVQFHLVAVLSKKEDLKNAKQNDS